MVVTYCVVCTWVCGSGNEVKGGWQGEGGRWSRVSEKMTLGSLVICQRWGRGREVPRVVGHRSAWRGSAWPP